MHVQQRSGWWIVPLLSVLSLGAAGGETPLIEAVKSGDVTTLRALMQQRVDVNLAEPDGTTALHWAAHRDDLGAADLLIGAGADDCGTDREGGCSEGAASPRRRRARERWLARDNGFDVGSGGR